jgi:chromosome partitioning protein
MSKIIAVANQKGGVGKTTTAINLAASLAHLGQETLLIDMDPQGNATSGLGIDKKTVQKHIYQVLMNEVPLDDVLMPTELDWLDLAPAHIDLIGAEIELVNTEQREFRLQKALSRFHKVYRYIIVDCPPSLGLLTLNSLVAAHSVVVPVQCEYYSLEGLGQLLKTIDLIRQGFNAQLALEGVLLTMYDSRVNLSRQVIDEIKKYFGDKVYNTRIPRTVRLAEAPSFGKPVLLYDKSGRATKAYLDMAKELLAHQPVAPAAQPKHPAKEQEAPKEPAAPPPPPAAPAPGTPDAPQG